MPHAPAPINMHTRTCTLLMISLTHPHTGEVHVKMAYNGVAGWMALGLGNPAAQNKGGMMGAHIVMAINDPNEALVKANNVRKRARRRHHFIEIIIIKG